MGSLLGRVAELDFLGGSHSAGSGRTSPYIATHPIFTTANEAVTTMQAGWRDLETALVLNEISHHGTQICVLRDLYRLRDGRSIERLVD